VTFTNTIDFFLDSPEPASKHIPDWYKELPSYLNGNKKPNGTGQSEETVKKCMPVFDAISAGYIITTPVDVYVSEKDGVPWYEWAALNAISFHPVEQAPTHPQANGMPYPKWINPWSVKTPKGYSCLFVRPFHRESVFSVLPGVVDTDEYYAPVNFPFVMNDVKFEGLIPAGTPMVQVIPFKRDSWKSVIGGPEDVRDQERITSKLRTVFFDSYKNKFRASKEYK